ncbi:MAG: DUF805 domain-containing protein [Gammaproteobacteria bacterium]|nr:DUF805 domain-containing protein [Gammaproteobacteria bacterium]MBU1482314.1 DUF805 domain-containing protein [Gammaproteobacteria bacterium]
MAWYLDVLKNYAVFDGRAGREEFWQFTLINIFVTIILYASMNDLWAVYTVAVLIPSIAVSVRRLHDIDRSGWWFLIAIVPVIDVVLLFMMLLEGKPGANQYGFNPKDVIA